LGGYQSGRGLDPCHRRDKPIAAPGHSLDAAAVCSPIIEDPTKRGDLHGQVAVLDDGSRPHRLHDLVPGDEITRAFDQDTQNFEGAGADRYGNESAAVILPKQVTPVEAEALEQEDVCTGERVHASASPGEHDQGLRAPGHSRLRRSTAGILEHFQTDSKDFIAVLLPLSQK
jgi:hypothetical protein